MGAPLVELPALGRSPGDEAIVVASRQMIPADRTARVNDRDNGEESSECQC